MLTELGIRIVLVLIPCLFSLATVIVALRIQSARHDEQIKNFVSQLHQHFKDDDNRFEEIKLQLSDLAKERRADSEKLFNKIDSVNEKVNSVNVKLAENLNALKK